MKARGSLFLLLGLCLTFGSFVTCEEPDEFDGDDGVTVEDDSVSCK